MAQELRQYRVLQETETSNVVHLNMYLTLQILQNVLTGEASDLLQSVAVNCSQVTVIYCLWTFSKLVNVFLDLLSISLVFIPYTQGLLFRCSTAPSGPGPSQCLGFTTTTLTHHTRQDFSGGVTTSTSQHTTLTRNIHSCLRRDFNQQSQEASGRRSTPYTARPPESVF